MCTKSCTPQSCVSLTIDDTWPNHSSKMANTCSQYADKSRVQSCVLQAAQELGYSSMKPEQLEVVSNFVNGRDVFAILPTGFGKSLCYMLAYQQHLMPLVQKSEGIQ